MRISIQTFFDGNQREPLAEYVAGVAGILEARGFAGIWLPEHVVNFERYDPEFKYPYSPDGTPPELMSRSGMLEPLAALSFMAAHSTSLRLGTGIAILPQRNPVYFAKMTAALDLLSGGRFIAGLGLGWSPQEYAATQTEFAQRGARMRDHVQVLKTLWADEFSEFHGRFYDLPRCIQLPKPARTPPIYFGGEGPAALRRVAEFGQGWFGLQLGPAQLPPLLRLLAAELAKAGRGLEEITLVTSPPPGVTCDRDLLAAYHACGVAEIVIICMADSLDGFRAEADRLARELVEPAARLRDG